MCLEKTWIRLCIRAVWSVFAWCFVDSKVHDLSSRSIKTDQTLGISSWFVFAAHVFAGLIWIFAGHICVIGYVFSHCGQKTFLMKITCSCVVFLMIGYICKVVVKMNLTRNWPYHGVHKISVTLPIFMSFVVSPLFVLTFVLLSEMSCLCKQCRSRSVGFFRSQLIWICTVWHSVCKFISTIWIK